MSDGRSVAVLSLDDATWLGRWRTLPSHEACEAEDRIWIRGPGGPGWAVLPALERFTEDTAGRLTPLGRRVPVRRAPEARWMPLSEFLRVRPPAAALPAQHIAPVAWSLVASHDFRAPDLLVLPFQSFAGWCLRAASVRLRSLQFAVAEDGRACVRGSLLPALPGEGWCVSEALAVPAGWALPRGITPRLVSTSLRLAPGELALLHTDASAERLPAEAFLEVTRASIRATLKARG